MNILYMLDEATIKILPLLLILFLSVVTLRMVASMVMPRFPFINTILNFLASFVQLIFMAFIIIFAVCCVVSLLFWVNVFSH